LAERDALKVKRDVALRAWKGAAADRDKAQRQVAELKAEVAALKVENERLQHDNEQLATEANDNAHAAAAQAQRGRELRAEVESLKVANLRWQEIADGMNREVESLKAKLAALSAGEQSAEATRTALEADLAEFKEVAAFETAEALKYEAQLNALEGALKAKAEEWRKRADYCEQVGLQPQAVMLRQHAAELDALLSAPASAGSAGQETSSPQEPR
jgi:chromosome segregation ATPase